MAIQIKLVKGKMFKTLLVVGMGSFVGGILRYLLSRYIQNFSAVSFPWGTLWVNVVGCFLIGLFYGLFEKGNLMNPHLRLFMTVGFCGGFTTFSTFMNESFQLLKSDDFLMLLFYLALSLLGGFLSVYIGYQVVRIMPL